LSVSDENNIISILSSFRYLFQDISQYPEKILKDIKKTQITEKVIYPCDIIELRGILEQGIIISSFFIPLFSFSFANKYLKKYPIFIFLNKNNLDVDKKEYGGIEVYQTDSLYIKDAILQIIINQPISEISLQYIFKILKETGFENNYSFSNSIPGLSSQHPKLSAKKKIELQFLHNYQAQRNIMLKNWYNKNKIGQVLPFFRSLPYTMDEVEDKEIKKGTIPAKFPFEEGMKIRDRRRGIAVPQKYGIVEKIDKKNNKMEVKWFDSKGKKLKKEVYDIDDTASLFLVLSEV